MAKEKIDALVLAGGINRISLYDDYIPGYKGLVPFCGKPSIQYVLEAVDAVPQVSRICIDGPEKDFGELIGKKERYEYISASDTPGGSIKRGLRHLHDSEHVLLIPSDLPLITPSAIEDFIKACGRTKKSRSVQFYWAMVTEESFVGPYREVKKGFNRFRDISVCHGNLFLADPRALTSGKLTSIIDRIYSARKSSLRSAYAASPLTGIYYLLGVHLFRIFTLDQMASFVSKSAGIEIAPVVCNHPEVAIDVDEPDDYRFVKARLEEQDCNSQNQQSDL